MFDEDQTSAPAAGIPASGLLLSPIVAVAVMVFSSRTVVDTLLQSIMWLAANEARATLVFGTCGTGLGVQE